MPRHAHLGPSSEKGQTASVPNDVEDTIPFVIGSVIIQCLLCVCMFVYQDTYKADLVCNLLNLESVNYTTTVNGKLSNRHFYKQNKRILSVV